MGGLTVLGFWNSEIWNDVHNTGILKLKFKKNDHNTGILKQWENAIDCFVGE